MRTLPILSVLTTLAVAALAPCQGLIVPEPMPRPPVHQWQPPLEVSLLQVRARIVRASVLLSRSRREALSPCAAEAARWREAAAPRPR